MKKSNRHWYTSALLFAFAAGWFCAGIAVLIDGEFWEREGGGIVGGIRTTLIRPDTHPYTFWGAMIWSFGFGACLVWKGVIELRRYIQQRRSKRATIMQDLQAQMISRER